MDSSGGEDFRRLADLCPTPLAVEQDGVLVYANPAWGPSPTVPVSGGSPGTWRGRPAVVHTFRPSGKGSLPLEAELQAILTNSSVALGVHVDGRWLVANPAAVRMFGCTSDQELLGTSILEVLVPEERERVAGYLRQREEPSGGPHLYVTRGLRKSGETFEMEVSVSTFLLEGRRNILVALRDISEALRQETLLRESEERYRVLVQSSPDGILLHQSGRIRFVNQAACRIFGASVPEDLAGSTLLDRVHPDFHAAVLDRVHACLDEGKPLPPLEEKLLRLDGTVVEAEVTGGRLDIGEPPTMLVVIRELTERRESQARLNSLLNRYQTLMKTDVDGIHILDPSGRLVEANPAFCRMLGYDESEILGLSVSDWDAQWPRELLLARIAELIGHPDVFETRHRRKDGTVIDVEISGVGIVLDGQTYLYASSRDISDRKRMDQERRQTQKLESIGILAGGIAHDFNNIMAGISGLVDLARINLRTGKADEALRRLDKVPPVFDRGRALTRRLLTFSKGGDPIRTSVALGPLLEGWVEFALVGSDVTARIEIALDLWDCHCDPNQVSQVMNNLLINARQASSAGGQLEVRAFNVTDRDLWVALQVEDHGSGIPQDHLDKIFDPFFTTKTEGTGLGLAVSYSIVKHHGGRIVVRSESGRGTLFTVYLPASACPDSGPAGGPCLPNAGGGIAIVMDDEDSLRDTVGELLSLQGYTVRRARDGREVLSILDGLGTEASMVQLLVLDNLIPGGMGGRETLQHLKGRGLGAKVVLMSGYFDSLPSGPLPDLDGVVKLPKPFSPEDLYRAIGKEG